jgi:hypothetical protein
MDSPTTFSRRGFLRGAAGTMAFLSLPAFARPRFAEDVAFTFGTRRFPLLLPGESVTASEPVRDLTYFLPLFGTFRKCVNPAEPVVHERTITFTEPGEYYLRVNGRSPLKVAVFAQDEGIPASLLRLFDFAVANSLYISAEDKLWYSGREQFLGRFFTSAEPFMLSCGPTHQLFRRLVEDRFCLPARIVTCAGRFYRKGKIAALGHNVPEVYVPELDQYVLFDINTGLVPLWDDALSLSAKLRRLSPVAVETETPDWSGVKLHADVRACSASPEASSLVHQYDQYGAVRFAGQLISNDTVDEHAQARALRGFYTGAGYWGKKITWVMPTGTEFLDGWLQYGLYETDPALIDDMMAALKPLIPETMLVDPDVLRERLRDGHRANIAAREWTKRFPAPATTL